MRNKWYYVSILLAILILASLSGAARAQPETWIRIQNGSQGYALYCPQDAIIRRYDPEGVLRIEVADSLFVTIYVYENSEHMSAQQWTDAIIVEGQVEDDYKVGPPAVVVSRSGARIGNHPTETLLLSSGNSLSRSVILATSQHLYRIDYPAGHRDGESILESIVATFEPGEFNGDEGFVVVTATPASISSLAVPAYSQNNTQWKCDQLGTCICNFGTCADITYTTIGDGGCHITSIAMLFDYYSSLLANPQALNTCLTDDNQYRPAVDFCTLGSCGIDHPVYPCIPPGVTFEGVSYAPDFTRLDQDLSNGFPAVGRKAAADGTDGGHSVAVIGKNGSNYEIIDPWDGEKKEVAPSWFLSFWHYHGPVGTCCGCLPANCCSSADIALPSNLATTNRWIDPGVLSSATLLPSTTSGTCQAASAQLLIPIAVEEMESAVPDEPDLLDVARSSVADAPVLAPIEGISASVEPVDALEPGTSPAQWDAVDPQRTPPTSANYSIVKAVFGSGGGKKTSTNYVMNSTQGQSTDLSHRSSASYRLLPGYWGASSPHSFQYRVYLPVILRED